MDSYTLYKALHVLGMFVAVTAFVGGGVLFRLVMRGGDTRAIAGAGTAVNVLTRVGGLAVVVALVFGFLTAANGGWDLLAPWLVIAYAIVIALAIIGPIEGGGYARIAAAAAAEGDGPPSEALRRQMADPRLRLMTTASVVLYALVVLDMVIKPFR